MSIFLHHETVIDKLTKISQNENEISFIHALYTCQTFQRVISWAVLQIEHKDMTCG